MLHSPPIAAQIVTVPMTLPLNAAWNTYITFLVVLLVMFAIIFVILNLLLHYLVIHAGQAGVCRSRCRQPRRRERGTLRQARQGRDSSLSVSFNRMRERLKHAMAMLK
jgi:hypothetical protein